jgi:ABC-2 type transport system ATP-binding protein
VEHRPTSSFFGSELVYGGRRTLPSVSLLTVTERTIFALLGPNGAGKTTPVRIPSTLIAADAGAACVGAHDVVHHANRCAS